MTPETINLNEKLSELAKTNNKIMSIPEIADYCGVSKQAIQQAEARAVMKLRRALYPVFKEHFGRIPKSATHIHRKTYQNN